MRKALIALVCPAVCACGPRDTRPDLAKLAELHKKIAAIDRRVTAASNAYTGASNAALDHDDRVAIGRAALALHDAMEAIRPDAAKLTVPDFKNNDVGEQAGQVLASLLVEIDADADAAISLQAMIDPAHPSPGEITALQSAQDRANNASISEGVNLVAAYQDLGITPDRIDTKNGGLKPAKR
jgi:hypothetical protein